MTVNIFEMSQKNSEYLDSEYNMVVTTYGDPKIIELFSNKTKDIWAISINMGSSRLKKFLNEGRYKNVYESTNGEIQNENSREAVLKKRLKDKYELRTIFNNEIENGEVFKYGAMNIGGVGIRYFGEYCTVINRECLKLYTLLAFVKEDSLHYVKGNKVDCDRMSKEIANANNVHILAVIKHQNDLKSCSLSTWPSIVCCDSNYIEAIVTDDILLDHISSVRISRGDYDLFIRRYLFNYLASKSMTDEMEFEVCKLDDFGNILKLLRENKIELEVLDD